VEMPPNSEVRSLLGVLARGAGMMARRHVGRLIVSNRTCRSVWFLEPYLGNACGGCWRTYFVGPALFSVIQIARLLLKILIDRWNAKWRDIRPSFHSLYFRGHLGQLLFLDHQVHIEISLTRVDFVYNADLVNIIAEY
jgi:hypothetical protein